MFFSTYWIAIERHSSLILYLVILFVDNIFSKLHQTLQIIKVNVKVAIGMIGLSKKLQNIQAAHNHHALAKDALQEN